MLTLTCKPLYNCSLYVYVYTYKIQPICKSKLCWRCSRKSLLYSVFCYIFSRFCYGLQPAKTVAVQSSRYTPVQTQSHISYQHYTAVAYSRPALSRSPIQGRTTGSNSQPSSCFPYSDRALHNPLHSATLLYPKRRNPWNPRGPNYVYRFWITHHVDSQRRAPTSGRAAFKVAPWPTAANRRAFDGRSYSEYAKRNA